MILRRTFHAPSRRQFLAALFASAGGAPFESRSLRFYGDDPASGGVARVRIPVDDTTDPPIDLGSGDFTVEFWVRGAYANNTRTDASDIRYSHPFVDRDVYGFQEGFVFGCARRSGNRLCAGFGVADTGLDWLTSWGAIDIGDDAWHHLRYTWEPSTSTMRLWVDGTFEVSRTYSISNLGYVNGRRPSSGIDNQYWVIGTEKHSLGYGFNGRITEIRFSNTLRSTGTANFTVSRAKFQIDANTVGLYHFEDDSGGTAVDSSGVSGSVNGELRIGGASNGPTWDADGPFIGIIPPGTASGLSANSGAVSVSKLVAGQADGISINSGAITVEKPVAGAADGIAVNSGAASVEKPVAGAADGIAVNSGALAVEKLIAGQADGVALNSGVITGASITGTADGIASNSGAVSVSKLVAGQADGISINSGAITVEKPVAGAADGIAVNSGAVSAGGSVAGAADGVASNSGTVSVSKLVAGQADGIALNSGSIAAGGAVAGQADGIAVNSGAVTVEKRIVGQADGIAANSGAVTVINAALVAGVADGVSANSGSVTVGKLVAGQADGIAVNSGAILGLVIIATATLWPRGRSAQQTLRRRR